MIKPFIYLCIGIFGVYVYFCGMLFFKQKSMIYFPNNQDFYKCKGFQDYEKVNSGGTRFYLKKRGPKIIVHYHGNAGSACDLSYLKSFYEKTDYSILFVEYAGYSNDSISPSIHRILNDVVNVRDYLKGQNFEKIVVYGRSLGTGPASYHAKIGKVDKLILVTPFSSFVKLVKSKYPLFPVSLLLTEKYDNEKWLENYTGEALILHGDQDELVPYSLGKSLFDSLKTTKKDFVTISGKGHNTLDDNDIFYEKILDFLEK